MTVELCVFGYRSGEITRGVVHGNLDWATESTPVAERAVVVYVGCEYVNTMTK